MLHALPDGQRGRAHPALEILAARFQTDRAAPDALGFGLPDLLRARYTFEEGWLNSLTGLRPSAATVLAARTAVASIGLDGGRTGCAATPIASLLSDTPTHAVLTTAAASLQVEIEECDVSAISRLWRLAAPAENLLATGGDDRLTLATENALNRYGCAPWPRPDVIGFGSCTASSLSADAFAAVESARRALIANALLAGEDQALAAACRRTEAAILDHFGVADLAAAILTASGTDAALTVTGLLASETPDTRLTSVLVSPSETGSGVPLAVQGRHFAGQAPDGGMVTKGEALLGLQHPPGFLTVVLRDTSGAPRAASHILQDCEEAIAQATAHGRAILHAIDGSKTGLTAPDRPALLRLRKRFGGRLDIVIDACQARIEPALMRWYLSHGFAVLVTGSKFFAAPGFCGTILFPRERLARIASGTCLPAGLAGYARLQGGLASRQCPGLLLRWAAALQEMALFGRLTPDEVGHRLTRLGQAATEAIGADRRLDLAAAPRPTGMGWSDRRSVFTFAVRGQAGWLDPTSLRRLYLALQDATPNVGSGASAMSRICQIGQPVELGSPDIGGLRIAFSASQVAADRDIGPDLRCVVEKLGCLLDAAPDARFGMAPARAASLVSS